MADKKNTDYRASAVNLCNPIEVQIGLEVYLGLTEQIEQLKAEIETYIPQEKKNLLSSLETQLATSRQAVLINIDQYGSYQDLGAGHYALKQRKVSKSYSAELFETHYPQFAPAIIIKAVDTAKLNGLIKGGLITEDSLRHTLIMTETESHAYIIK